MGPLVLVLVLVLGSMAFGAAPEGLPVAVSGELLFGSEAATQPVARQIAFAWSDDAGGYVSVVPGQGVVSLVVDGAGVVSEGGVVVGDWSDGVLGRGLALSIGEFVPMQVDYGMGRDLGRTMGMFGHGLMLSVVLFFLTSCLGWFLRTMRRLGLL